MAILKHIASKSADYGEAQRYLMFKHDEYTGKPILDESGELIPREEYYLDGINCNPFTFDLECKELNAQFHKNQAYNEIKSHHYILSFDPKDVEENGLTGERAQQLGLEYARKNFPGHQALVCTHMDGNNESGNIHVHIVINSLRKLDVEAQSFMERPCDSRAGYKHHLTKDYLIHLKQSVMDMCQREHLYDLENSFVSIKAQAGVSRKALKATEIQLKEVNEQIHYTGQYLANKAIYSEFCKSKNKGKFRQEHSAEIALYESARKFLKEKSPEGKLPSMKLLKEKKAELLKQQQANQGQYHYYRNCQKELTTARTNVDMILSKKYSRQKEHKKDQYIS